WDARVLDLDLLMFGDEVISSERLAVPHPRMAFRRFVLAPAAEVAPTLVHPLIGWSTSRLLAHLDDAPPYVALLGPSREVALALAAKTVQMAGGALLSNPAGPILEPPIQFLDRAVRLLAGHDWRSPQLVVSDFYVDECLAYARAAAD